MQHKPLYTAKFNHPVPADKITEENYKDIADDLYYLQSDYMIGELIGMIEIHHWGDDDTDYHTTMREAHGTLQNIAYDGSRDNLLRFLFASRKDLDELEEPLPVDYIDSAGGLCDALRSYLPKDY